MGTKPAKSANWLLAPSNVLKCAPGGGDSQKVFTSQKVFAPSQAGVDDVRLPSATGSAHARSCARSGVRRVGPKLL